MISKDFDVSTFLDHLIFRWLHDSYFDGLLFTTQDVSSLRQAVMNGWALPTTVLFRNSPPTIEDASYGRSVTKRQVEYNGSLVSCQLIDYLVKYSFFTASYLLQPINEVYQQVVNLDIDRYFEFDLSMVLPPTGRTKAEFRKASQDFKPELNDDTAQRKFYISVDWELRITVPCLESPLFIEQVNLFINNNPIASIGG
jgi:hypothetical protein